MKKKALWALIILLVAVSCRTVPVTGRQQLDLVGSDTLLALSFSEYDKFLKQHKVITKSEDAAMVRRTGQRIQKAVEKYFSENKMSRELKGYKWEFTLVEDKTVNAWCMPGGKVVVYTGILPVTKNEAGLAVVMGHEIAHAVANHGGERMSQGLLAEMGGVALSVALSSKPSETSDLFLLAYGVGTTVGVLLPYSRMHETEADGNYRLAYDRINTFVLSSTIFQSIPGITAGVANTSFGQAGGRLRDGLPTLQPTATPESFLQPPPVSNNISTVVAPDFQAPRTHAWSISFQRELWSRGTLDIAYIGRRADHLFGAYNVNQAEIFKNGFLDAFRVVKAGGENALMNQLCAPDSRRGASESGSAMVRRLYASDLTNNSVAAIAASLASRIQSGQSLPELAGLGRNSWPQPPGGSTCPRRGPARSWMRSSGQKGSGLGNCGRETPCRFGFGSFEPRQRGARNGRDPKTGKSISIRASVVQAFRPGSALKALVNRRK